MTTGVGKMPAWLEPMAATLTEERSLGSGWLYERKFDGIRLLAYKRGNDVELFSRNRLPQHLPSVAAAVAKLPVNDAIEYTRQACEALQYVHDQQIVHRDVKPANLIDAGAEGVVLVDERRTAVRR